MTTNFLLQLLISCLNSQMTRRWFYYHFNLGKIYLKFYVDNILAQKRAFKVHFNFNCLAKFTLLKSNMTSLSDQELKSLEMFPVFDHFHSVFNLVVQRGLRLHRESLKSEVTKITLLNCCEFYLKILKIKMFIVHKNTRGK